MMQDATIAGLYKMLLQCGGKLSVEDNERWYLCTAQIAEIWKGHGYFYEIYENAGLR